MPIRPKGVQIKNPVGLAVKRLNENAMQVRMVVSTNLPG